MKEKNAKFTVMCSRSTQNLEFAHFALFSFALDGKEMYQNVLHCTHVQSDCSPSLGLLFCGVALAVLVV